MVSQGKGMKTTLDNLREYMYKDDLNLPPEVRDAKPAFFEMRKTQSELFWADFVASRSQRAVENEERRKKALNTLDKMLDNADQGQMDVVVDAVEVLTKSSQNEIAVMTGQSKDRRTPGGGTVNFNLIQSSTSGGNITPRGDESTTDWIKNMRLAARLDQALRDEERKLSEEGQDKVIDTTGNVV